jgi:hypothetical protein
VLTDSRAPLPTKEETGQTGEVRSREAGTVWGFLETTAGGDFLHHGPEHLGAF